jgi:L-aminopeptidase/D-esterase-like protein
VFLSGGSAFGLDVATGVRRYLYERKIGFDTRVARVPIVPGAIIFDLGVGGRPDVWPTAECGFRATMAARTGAVEEGNVGAGAGATVGKMPGAGGPMKGGVGTASLRVPSGAQALIVTALVVVNAVGDVTDPQSGSVIAGVLTPDGKALADARTLVRRGSAPPPKPGQNTTIGVVATNARLTKVQATKVAQMAQDGLARAIYPSHTMADGDTIFALATGEIDNNDVTRIGALASDAVVEAIVRGVQAATSIPGFPAAREYH